MSAYYNEIDPKAAAWLRELINQGHIAPGEVDERSISDVRPDDLAEFTQCHFFAGIGVWSHALRQAGWSDDRAVWTGSCPCQPFSSAGKGKGVDDERHLWPDWFHLITQCRPSEVFGEQVASKDGRAWFDTVQADLEALGFAVGAADLCAAGVGAPHIRQRLWFYGQRGASGHIADVKWREYDQPLTMADTNGVRRTRIGWGGEARIAEYRTVDGMADSTSRCVGDEREQRSGEHGLFTQDGSALRTGHQGSRVESQRMADDDRGTSGQGREVSRRRDQGSDADAGRGPSGGDGTNTAHPTNGFWRDADWLGCRDGKFRPVEPMHVKMVDGPAGSVVSLCAKEDDTELTRETMQELQRTLGAQEVPERSFRGQRAIRITNVLRQVVHGTGLRRDDQSDERQEQSSPIGKNAGGVLPSMREEAIPRPSCERNTHGQFPAELDDVVRLLSPSLSLAELYNRRETEVELQALLETIREEGSVFDPSIPTKEIWASLSEEAKDRVGLGFDAARWVRVDTSPLASKIDGRVTMLRGYGNAIVSPVAQTFIEATQGW